MTSARRRSAIRLGVPCLVLAALLRALLALSGSQLADAQLPIAST